jgi:perosamine synthetase
MIPYGRHHVDEQDIEAVVEVLRGGLLTQGPMVEAFEGGIAETTGAKYAVAVSSATAGLHIASLAAGLVPGSTLVTSPITFVASANAALYAGAKPAFADIDPQTINMSPDRLRETLREHPDTKVVIPVHFAGFPCDMEAIRAVASEAGAAVIEDAAHALGGSYADGTPVGSNSYADMTVFSFHPVKAIAAGEGGVVTTNDERYYRRLIRLRSHGINKLDDPLLVTDWAVTGDTPNPWYYEMQEIGFHYRITDIQCALALSQLKKLDAFMTRRRALAAVYDETFAGFANMRPAQLVDRSRSGNHLYVVWIDFEKIGIDRGTLMRQLRERGIGSQVHYIPVPAMPVYRERQFRPEDYPASLDYYRHGLSIPLFYDLTDEQQQDVIAAFRELVG